MSEENEKKTPEEIKAELALKEAETRKTEAEARKTEAEASKAEYDAYKARVDYEKTVKNRAKELALDEENHLYRFSGSVNEGSVRKCMGKLTEWTRLDPKCDIEIVFSSPGGSIIDGFELFDFIQELRIKGHKVTTGSLGMAASMAGILLQAGDHRWIGHQSWLMIHRAAFGAIGKTYEVEDEVKLVKRIEDRILDIFIKRSKLTKLKIKRNWDRKDWWIDADESVSMGLVDEVRGELLVPEASDPKKSK
jgi:ATP-dependent Clp endopeptidase proteolytic subunit ClpP